MCGVFSLSVSCRPAQLVSPKSATLAYAEAIERQDVDALWELMSIEARQALSKADLKGLLLLHRAELKARARAIRKSQSAAHSQAIVLLDQGQQVELKEQEGRFVITADPLLVLVADTPIKAIERFRIALEARDLEQLFAGFAPSQRDELSLGLESLERALSELEFALVDINGTKSTVTFPGGTVIHLQQSSENWLITEIQ